MNQSKTIMLDNSDCLALGDAWHGLDLDHPELVDVVNAVRSWFNTNARKWARGGQVGGNALAVAGHYGTGKSHIAHVVRRLVGRHNCVFWEEPDLVAALWESYKQGNKATERRIYREARQSPLLILDDLGSAHVNSEGWLHQLYYNLFAYDPIQGRGGILITTNLAWNTKQKTMPFASRVGPRAMSRLMHQLDGPDPERKNIPHNWHEMWNVKDRRFDYRGLFQEPERIEHE